MKRRCIHFIHITGLMGLLTIGMLLRVGYLGYQEVVKKVPITQKVQSIQADDDYVKIEEISPLFLQAIVAVEDRRFYNHGGVDAIGVTRALVTNLVKGELVQGGSTITQQLAKNMYFEEDKTLRRKLEELFVAAELEKQHTKEEILELYVNMIYYGDGHYGIEEASQGYFGKKASDLNFDEATLLAGLPQAPSKYALSSHYELAKKRQSQVIAALQ